MNDMEDRVIGFVEAGADSGAGICGDVSMLVERASERGRLIRRATIRRRVEAKYRAMETKKVCEEILSEWQESKAQTDRKEVIHF